jgi:hypothetical protein
MDERWRRAALDLSGRPYFVFDGAFARERVGDLPTELVPHFFRSLCESARREPQPRVRGRQRRTTWSKACFKAYARALRAGIAREGATAEHQGDAVMARGADRSGGANIGRCVTRCSGWAPKPTLTATPDASRRPTGDPARRRRGRSGDGAPARPGLVEVDPRLSKPVLASASACSCCSSVGRGRQAMPGLLPARHRALPASASAVPHMGWNARSERASHLLDGTPTERMPTSCTATPRP